MRGVPRLVRTGGAHSCRHQVLEDDRLDRGVETAVTRAEAADAHRHPSRPGPNPDTPAISTTRE